MNSNATTLWLLATAITTVALLCAPALYMLIDGRLFRRYGVKITGGWLLSLVFVDGISLNGMSVHVAEAYGTWVWIAAAIPGCLVGLAYRAANKR